jgi:hypothetical protein
MNNVENPSTPNKEQNTQPNHPEPEVNPAKPGNDTEVDLDKSKTKTYPDKTPPERH